jgi:hypothetical protein
MDEGPYLSSDQIREEPHLRVREDLPPPLAKRCKVSLVFMDLMFCI